MKAAHDRDGYDIEFPINGIELDFVATVELICSSFKEAVKESAKVIYEEKINDIASTFNDKVNDLLIWCDSRIER